MIVKDIENGKLFLGLNPCCNGIYLMIDAHNAVVDVQMLGLNPCCNGIYLMMLIWRVKINKRIDVLILVVMEYT